MTPEERFTKIENAVQALAETQARHETLIEKQNAGIRDLVTVSRTILDSQKEVTSQVEGLRKAQERTGAQIQELRQSQEVTVQTLNSLIDTVDRFIRSRSNGHSDTR